MVIRPADWSLLQDWLQPAIEGALAAALLEGGEPGSADGAPIPGKQYLRSFTDSVSLCAWRGHHWGSVPTLLGTFIRGRAKQSIIVEIVLLL